MLSVACNIKPKMGLKVCSFVYVGFGDMAVSFQEIKRKESIQQSYLLKTEILIHF